MDNTTSGEAEELIIDESNFDDYFFDVRKHAPKVDQVLAKYRAVAAFGDGPHKRDVIGLLKIDKAQQAAMVMRKIHHAREPDCYRVCREICEDLASGMTDDEVAAKDYEYVLEAFYYTKREYVPKNDPHWETIQLLEYDPETGSFSVRIE
jgi:hypothetical protein